MTQPDPPSRPLGRFQVTTDRAALGAYREATGYQGGNDDVPVTFPVTWLAAPELAGILAKLYETVGSDSMLVLQTGQQFVYARPLRPDSRYLLDMSFDGPDRAGAYRLDASICDAGGTHVLDMTSTFVFVSMEDRP